MLCMIRTSTPLFARIAAFVIALVSVSVVQAAQSNAIIQSPSGVLSVEVAVDGDGRPNYAVKRNGKTVISPSRLGFLLADVPKLERNFEIDSQATRTSDETWE